MKGFTLLELMIVIALIATIATFGGMHVLESYRQGQMKVAETKCRTYYDSVYLWMMFTGAREPPRDLEEIESAGDRLAEWIRENLRLVFASIAGVLVIASHWSFGARCAGCAGGAG